MPEEINRILTDHSSDLLFAPTDTAIQNLLNEGFSAEQICLVGDVMYDAALYYSSKAKSDKTNPQPYILATIHRAENTDHLSKFTLIFNSLKYVSSSIMQVVLPLHPRTRKVAQEAGLLDSLPSTFQIIDPVGYLQMLALEKRAALIITDSGGVQKEAYFQRVPCLTLREETEWIELLQTGNNRLVKEFSLASISKEVTEILHTGWKASSESLYGGGQASKKIAEKIISLTT